MWALWSQGYCLCQPAARYTGVLQALRALFEVSNIVLSYLILNTYIHIYIYIYIYIYMVLKLSCRVASRRVVSRRVVRARRAKASLPRGREGGAQGGVVDLAVQGRLFTPELSRLWRVFRSPIWKSSTFCKGGCSGNRV